MSEKMPASSPTGQMKQLLLNLHAWLNSFEDLQALPTSELLTHFSMVPQWLGSLQQLGGALDPNGDAFAEAVQKLQNLVNELNGVNERLGAEIDRRIPVPTVKN